MAELNTTIKKHWSLIAFAKEFGKMQVGKFINKKDGEVFKSCIFTDEHGTLTFVSFSSKLGELTPAEIKSRKDGLQVLQLENNETHDLHYTLCSTGDNSWEDVDLGL